MSVVDASVITKWYKSEEKSSEADFILQEHVAGKETIFVPILLLYEVTNALMVSGKVSQQAINEAITALFDIQLQYVNPDEQFLKTAATISDKARITIYDASYVVLAQMFGCPLITADRKLHDRTQGMIDVRLLSPS
jgi:predicted nucleic acid-binding protein